MKDGALAKATDDDVADYFNRNQENLAGL